MPKRSVDPTATQGRGFRHAFVSLALCFGELRIRRRESRAG